MQKIDDEQRFAHGRPKCEESYHFTPCNCTQIGHNFPLSGYTSSGNTNSAPAASALLPRLPVPPPRFVSQQKSHSPPTPGRRPHGLSPCPRFLFLLLLTSPLFAFDTYLTGTPLNDAYYGMYNLNFDGAHVLIQQWMTAHPEDPLGPASVAAAFLFTEFESHRPEPLRRKPRPGH